MTGWKPSTEPDAEMLLEGGEGAGDGGLREPERGCGACDVARVGDGEEGPQVAQLDAAALSVLMRRQHNGSALGISRAARKVSR